MKITNLALLALILLVSCSKEPKEEIMFTIDAIDSETREPVEYVIGTSSSEKNPYVGVHPKKDGRMVVFGDPPFTFTVISEGYVTKRINIRSYKDKPDTPFLLVELKKEDANQAVDAMPTNARLFHITTSDSNEPRNGTKAEVGIASL